MTPRRWNRSVLYPNDLITSLGIILVLAEAAINCNKDQRKSHCWPRKQLLRRELSMQASRKLS